MPVEPIIHGIFGHFQNLNLVVLIEDLRARRMATGAWSTGTLLCPVAHGMAGGRVVADLRFLGHAAELPRACDYAARFLGADPRQVQEFVELWDSRPNASAWLLRQLEALWQERLEDAVAVQELLEEPVYAS